jgi:hypothetical protein
MGQSSEGDRALTIGTNAKNIDTNRTLKIPIANILFKIIPSELIILGCGLHITLIMCQTHLFQS